jgi:hypothetical protein
MSKVGRSARMSRLAVFGGLSTAIVCAVMALPAMADSQARIVRLSDVQGGVQINKNSGLGFENAFLNLPVTQGTQLRTKDNGRAEIEFEDGSTMRITPNTTVVFSTLGANDAGKRTSAVDLVAGQAYVNWVGKSGDRFALNFSKEKMELTQPAHVRVANSASVAEVASFKNDVEVVGPAGVVKVDKKKMADFDERNNDAATTAKIQDSAYDSWDKDSVSYHDVYTKNNSAPLGYGVSDLNYYGGYSNVAGFGTLWQPYFAGAGWNPFMDGAWSFYPGMGYMWASAYPWGWMPYYYGNWVYASGFGWGWQPGGYTGWHGGVVYSGAVAGFVAPVVPKGTVSTVVVGHGGATAVNAPLHTVVRNGTAGLGIARGSVDNLRPLNRQVARTGFAPLSVAPQFAATSPRVVGSWSGWQPMAVGSGRGGTASGGHSSGGAVASGHK